MLFKFIKPALITTPILVFSIVIIEIYFYFTNDSALKKNTTVKDIKFYIKCIIEIIICTIYIGGIIYN